jgi:RNA ligase
VIYDFPTIKTIDDVLPHIEGRDEFRVIDNGDYVVIKYMIAFEETFEWNNEDCLGSAIRRECRGLIFDKDGVIISRPFHKFFNCNEREETQIDKINLYEPHTITQKLDGSLIRFLRLNGQVFAATKAGITETSQQVDEFLKDKSNYYDFIQDTLDNGLTACFEWCSRKNRIVIDYPEDNLILTAIRNTTLGNYLLYDNVVDLANHYNIPVVKSISSLAKQDIHLLVNQVRELTNDEGIVLTFNSGHRVKIKADDYVLRHKVKEQINLEKNVIAIILNDGVDDLIPLLHPNDASRLKDFQRAFWKSFDEVSYEMAELFIAGNKMYPDRKDFAVEYVQKKISPIYSTIMYAMKSGRGSKEILLQLIEKSLISQTKIDQNRWMFGGLNWNSQEL